MDSVIDCACAASGFEREKPAKGSDIITGSEAGKTNKFLQILAFAACAVKTSVKAEFVMGGQPLGGGGEEWEDVEVEEVVVEEVEDLSAAGGEQFVSAFKGECRARGAKRRSAAYIPATCFFVVANTVLTSS